MAEAPGQPAGWAPAVGDRVVLMRPGQTATVLRLALTEWGLLCDLALDPLPGAREFLDWLRGEYQVAIVSDTFYELAMPLVKKLGLPTMLCHRLNVDADGRLSGYRLRQPDPKRNAVRGFKSMQYKVVATGDSYNDVPMLEEADLSWFFQPPENVVRDYPRIPIARSYAELKAAFTAAKSTLA